MKKLGILLAIVLPLLCAASQGTTDQQDQDVSSNWQMRKLAFHRSDSTAKIERVEDWLKSQEIYVIVRPDLKPKLLVKGEDPAWSPDGEKLAFSLPDKNGNGQIEIINADGSEQIQLTDTKGGAYHPAWSPDGQQIAFTLDDHYSNSIATVGKNGGMVRSITLGRDPQWSPDGRQIVFYRNRNRKASIWIVNTDGTNVRKVIEEKPQPRFLGLTGGPYFFDRNTIVFSASTGRNWCIFRVNLDGTGLEKIAENDEFELSDPLFSPDRKQLVVKAEPTGHAGSATKLGDAILLLDLPSKQWTHLANGTYPSVVWEKRAASVDTSSEKSTAPPATTTNESLIAKGKARYLDYKCGECHGANGEGGGDGPDLIGTRLNADEISKFLEKPSPDAYMKGMPNIPTDSPDHQALVAYVLSLKPSPDSAGRPGQPSPPPSEGQAKSDPPGVHKLSAAEKAHILDGEFKIEYKVDRLPDSLKSAFARLAKQPEFKMANPGEKFEATDVVTEPGLPNRRLIFAGVSNNRYFIHYEHGGWGYHCDLVVFDVNPEGKVSFLGGGSGDRAKDLAQLRALLASKAFTESGNYW